MRSALHSGLPAISKWLSGLLLSWLLVGPLDVPIVEAQTLPPTVTAPGANLSVQKGVFSADMSRAYMIGTTDASVSASHTFQGPGTDIFLSKVSLATGQVDWLFGMGAAAGVHSTEDANSITEAPDGSIFATGTVLQGTYPGQTSSYYDPWICKWDTSGNLQWITQVGSSGSHVETGGVVTDGSNAFFFATSVGFAYGTGVTLSSMDIFVFKVASATGTVALVKHVTPATTGTPFWGTSVIHGAHIYHGCSSGSNPTVFKIQTSDLSVALMRTVAIGFNQDIFSATFDFSKDLVYMAGRVNVLVGTVPGSTFGGAWDGFMIAYDFNTDTTQWMQQFGADASEEYKSIFLDSSGRLHAVGYTLGAVPGETGAGVADQFHIILNVADGTTYWSAQTGTFENDFARAAAVDSATNVFSIIDNPTALTVYRFTDPRECPAGHYFDATEKWSQCKPCSAGSITSAPATRSCTICPTGSGATSGNTLCAVCAAGTYSLNGLCVDCPEGTHSPLSGSVSCSICRRGSYSQSGAAQCTRCELGYYQDEVGQTSCKVCPNDATTSSSGSSEINQCICNTDQYGDPLNSSPTPCRDCNSNCQCDGGVVQVANKGYWVASDDPSYVVTCTVASACPGGLGQCNEGYHSTGCAKCDDGYYFSNMGACQHCDTWIQPVTSSLTFVIVGVTCIVLGFVSALFLGITYSRNRSELMRVHSSLVAVVRISLAQISAYQHLAIVFSLGTSISIPGGDVYKGIFSVFILDFSAFTGPLACQIGTQPPYSVTYFGRIAGLTLIMAGSIVVYVVVSSAKLVVKSRMGSAAPGLSKGSDATFAQLPTNQIDDDDAKIEATNSDKPASIEVSRPCFATKISINVGQAAVIVSLEFYFLLMLYIIEPFLCRERSSWEYAIMFRSDVRCYSDDLMWLQTAIPSLLMSGTLLIAPITMLIVVIALAKKSWLHGSTPTDTTLRHLATTFAPVMHIKYDSKFYWWELIILLRKMTFGICLHVAFKSPNDQCTWICLLFVASLLMHNVFRPFRSQAEDIHEMMSLIILVLTSFIVLLTSDEVDSISEYARTVLHSVFFLLILAHAIFYFKAVLAELTSGLLGVFSIRSILRKLLANTPRPVADPSSCPSKDSNPFGESQATPRSHASIPVKEMPEDENSYHNLSVDEAAKEFRKAAQSISLERRKRLGAKEEYEMLSNADLVGDFIMYKKQHVERIEEWLSAKQNR